MERQDFKDRQIRCVDCNAIFTFTAGEQFFFWSKGLSLRKRCPECIRKRKLTLAPDVGGNRGGAE